jgi:hypothetical protein
VAVYIACHLILCIDAIENSSSMLEDQASPAVSTQFTALSMHSIICNGHLDKADSVTGQTNLISFDINSSL